jgi:hypothetical protein
VDGRRVAVEIGDVLRVNDGDVLRSLAVQGAGLARLSLFHAWEDLQAGHLQVVLEDFNTGDLEPIHAVYPGKPDRLPPRTRAVLDFLQARVDLRHAAAAAALAGVNRFAAPAAHARGLSGDNPAHHDRPEQRIIYLQPAAPPKPAMGAACNGCGLCCLAEPCPLGIWVSRRRTGACKACSGTKRGSAPLRHGERSGRGAGLAALGRAPGGPAGAALDCGGRGLRRRLGSAEGT